MRFMKKVKSKASGARDWVIRKWLWLELMLSTILSSVWSFVWEIPARKVASFVRRWYYWARRKIEHHRAVKEAEKRLQEELGSTGDDGASSRADERVEQAAKAMAEKSPHALSQQQPRSSAADPPMDTPADLLPDEETVEPEPAVAETPNPFRAEDDDAGARVRKEQQERISDTYGFSDRDELVSYDTTTTEALTAEMMDAAEVVPPPRRSDVKKTDLTVRGAWEVNPNTAEELQQAARLPIVDNQIRKIVEHLVTSRPTITGPEDQAEIIREWFEVELEIGSSHERGLNRFVDEIADQLLRYGSAAVIKQRTRSSELDPYADPVTGGMRAPVWGYALPDMSTLQVFIDQRGRPRKWRQRPSYFSGVQDVKTYRARDVFMARLPVRQSSMYFWTPSLTMPVLYAIEVLRDLQDTIESHTKNIIDIPSYVRVGDEDYLDGKATPSMIDKVADKIRQASRGTMLVIPWYTKIEKVESEDYTEELVEVANFWETVVRRGVGGSQLDDGDPSSANRSTADTIDEMGMRAAQALVPEIQRAFRWLAIDKLFEHGYSKEDLKSHEDMVRLEFEDIDLAQQMAREGHIAFLFQNNLIKHGEARTRLGHDPDDEFEDIYFWHIQQSLETKDKTGEETESRARPNGQPKPKRKNDALDTALPDEHPGKINT